MAIGPSGKLQVAPGIRAGEISDERVRNIMRNSAFIREMKLPQILETRRFLDSVPGRGRSAFCSAIVHDGQARSDAVERSESTRLNSSHMSISYAVFCLKKKKKHNGPHRLRTIDVTQTACD